MTRPGEKKKEKEMNDKEMNNIDNENQNAEEKITLKDRLSGTPGKIAIAIIVLDIVLAAVSFFLLPETVVVQFSTKGSTPNELSKPLAILIPFVITAASDALYIKPDYQNNKKAIVSAAIGLILFLVIIFMNL